MSSFPRPDAIGYIIYTILVLLVLRQLWESRLDLRNLLLPVVLVAAAAYYLRAVPAGGSDIAFDLTLGAAGVALGAMCALTTRLRRGNDSVAPVRAGWIAACPWIVSLGARIAQGLSCSARRGRGAMSMSTSGVRHSRRVARAMAVSAAAAMLSTMLGLVQIGTSAYGTTTAARGPHVAAGTATAGGGAKAGVTPGGRSALTNGTSPGYAGYGATPSPAPTSVVVGFVVPALTCPASGKLAVIPGDVLGNGGGAPFLGAGIELLCSGGVASYHAVGFYNGPFTKLGLTIHPGDAVLSAVTVRGGGSTAAVLDQTTGLTGTARFAGFAATVASLGVDGAHFGSSEAGVPLFTPLHFTRATINGAALGSFSHVGLDMVGASTPLITVSALSTDGKAFTATFRNSAPPFWLSGLPGGELAGKAPMMVLGTLDDATAVKASDYRVVINWGDGTASTLARTDAASFDGTIGTPCPLPLALFPGRACFDVVGQHAYQAAGRYTIALTSIRPGARAESVYNSIRVFSASSPPPTPTLRSLGLLTFHYKDKSGNQIVRGCTATVVNAANLSTIITAAHCMNGTVFKGTTQPVTHLEFAPAHTGECWDNINGTNPQQIDVAKCGNNPFGVWYANPGDVRSASYSSKTPADDFAFIVLEPSASFGDVQAAVGGFPITWDTSTDPSTDPLQQQSWIISSYAADAINFAKSPGFGPFECAWNGNLTAGASASRLGMQLGHACSTVDPITGAENAFTPTCPNFPPVGSSGSPLTNDLNTRSHLESIGGILSTLAFQGTCGGSFRYTVQATKLGVDAQATYRIATSAAAG